MSNPENPAVEEKVTVAIKCSVKVGGALYAPNDILEVAPAIAQKLIKIGAAERYAVPAEAVPEDEAQAPVKESRRGKGKAAAADGDGDED